VRGLLAGLLLISSIAVAAPTVSQTAPSNGALYLAPATFAWKANASVSGATIVRVEFYANGTLIQTDTTSPYQFDWTGVAAGTYTLTAKAIDSTGASSTSAARTITVAATNTPPTVSLTTPADNARYLNPPSVTLSATASGPELNDIIARVDFYLNGALANTITQAPFSYAATGLALGTYTLTAVATDSQSAQTTSTARTFTVSNVNTPPTVSLVIPIDNSRWNSPATVTIQANANSGEANDTVSVGFYANGTLLGTRSSSPFSLVNNFSAGSYTITAIATDGQGAQTTSAARSITVSDTNLPPTVSISAPAAGANFPTAPAPSISVTTSTTAGEVNGWLTKVEFYANGGLIGTKTSGPWNFTWTNVAQGSYRLTAIAYDNFNAATTSAAVAITVGPLPKLHFIHVDHLNTPRLVADDQQRTVWRWDQQEPFGVNVPDENPSALGAFEFPLRFPGQYADRETNLAYNFFRDYDPGIGRYLESDPMGLPAGLGTYSYVKGDPLKRVDPLGLLDEGPGGGGGDGGGAQGICRLIATLPIGTVMLGVKGWYCIYRCETFSCPPKVWIYQTISTWKWGCQDTIPAKPRKPGLDPD
jgi:RHS repeat-associated protein